MFEVTDGGTLHLGGLFSRADIGTIVRSGGDTTIGIFAGIMDNSGGTWALTADTGTYQLLGYELSSSGEIGGGAITASGGAKLEVRVQPERVQRGGLHPADGRGRRAGGPVVPRDRGQSVPARRHHSSPPATRSRWLETTLRSPTSRLSRWTGSLFVLTGDASKLQVFDNNVLTLGPTTRPCARPARVLPI